MDNFTNKNSFANNHANTQKITLLQKSNAKAVTLDHAYSKSLTQFADKAYIINVEKHNAFCVDDYPNLSRVNFRRIIRKLGDNIERVGNGRPQFYKLRGIKLPGDTRKVTLEPMRVQEKDFVRLLATLKDQPPKIHAIKIGVDTSELHKMLLQKGYSKDRHNHSIKVNFDSIDNNVVTKILIYPKTFQVDLGCTYKPLIYDIKTIWYMHEHLSKISYHLSGLGSVVLPSVDSWIITHWHFGKDGTEAFNGQNFHYTVNDVNTGLIRFYSKSYPDGTVKPRLEQIQTPHTTIRDEMKKAMFGD